MSKSTLVRRSTLRSVIISALLVCATAAGPLSAANAAQLNSRPTADLRPAGIRLLPAPPPPPRAALPRRAFKVVSAAAIAVPPRASLAKAAAPQAVNQYAGAPGANANQNTLVLYDSTGQWGWLGEAYGVMAGNLASHGSKYTLQPAAGYVAGELNSYTGLIYVGSTYDEPLPTAFLDDVLATSKPVLWMNDNIWQLAARASDFAGQYGFTPNYFDFSNTLTVTYKGVDLQRNALSVPTGLLQTVINDPTKAQALAIATNDVSGTINWATRGGNLTYIGEIPFSYAGMNDRYLVAADLIGNVSNPTMPSRKRALVRIEDVSFDDDPADLRAVANYLYSKHVPFSVAVIPYYRDPKGAYNNGVPVQKHLYQASKLVSALRYMQSRGGTLLMHGYTHQYSNLNNPYTGVSADDFEFYRAHISPDNYVTYDTPVAEDSTQWAQARIVSGMAEFVLAGLSVPTIFEPPHYAASAVDYKVFQPAFTARYDRGFYPGNWCPNGICGTGTADYSKAYGQFFPYLVRDIYGSVVIPEGLGNVELVEFNHNPPRLPADILNSAHANTVIQDGVQSFFFHPYLDINYLKQVVEGLQAMGYTFVAADTVKQG